MISPKLLDICPIFLLVFSPIKTVDLLILFQPSGDGYSLMCSQKSSLRGTGGVEPRGRGRSRAEGSGEEQGQGVGGGLGPMGRGRSTSAEKEDLPHAWFPVTCVQKPAHLRAKQRIYPCWGGGGRGRRRWRQTLYSENTIYIWGQRGRMRHETLNIQKNC